jgi:hypothetical protein
MTAQPHSVEEIDHEKRAAAEQAVEFVESGMVVGLGGGGRRAGRNASARRRAGRGQNQTVHLIVGLKADEYAAGMRAQLAGTVALKAAVAVAPAPSE